jgi:hypothetical protein
MYGSMGTRVGYLPFLPGAISTTAMGRKSIEKASTFLVDQYGANLIYGDTDSIFINFNKPLQETIDFVEKIVKNSVAVKGLDGHATTRYWMSALSFAIQKAVSEAILKRSLLVNSAQTLGAHSKDKSSQHIHSADTINGRKHFRSTTFHPKFNNSRFPTYDNNSTPYDQSQNTPHLSSTVVTSIESVHDDDSEQDNDQDVKDNSFELDSIDD